MESNLNEAFDVPNEEGSKFDLIPAGKYKGEIVKASVAPTKNGRGEAVSLQWSIDGGEFDKRLIFQLLLLKHESADAQRFGRQKFRDICAAVGINEPLTDLDKL